MSAGVIELPDGTRLRGRGIRAGAPGSPPPQWSLFLLASAPRDVAWPYRWLRWRDFWVPSDRADARASFMEAHLRAASGERVEIACFGGRGRTGTALACIAQLGGVSAREAVEWTREAYDWRAVETPWQRRYVRRFTSGLACSTPARARGAA
jgi:protein-tyrosine phosphatase